MNNLNQLSGQQKLKVPKKLEDYICDKQIPN